MTQRRSLRRQKGISRGARNIAAKRLWAKRVHENLTRWRSPGEFLALVKKYDRQITSADLFHSRDFNFFTEALALAEFVTLHPVDEVRLSGLEHPDAFIRIGSEQIGVEITEALNEGRRRGSEYCSELKVVHVPQEQMDEHRAQLGPQITKVIQKKVGRGNANIILVVHTELLIHELSAEDEALIRNLKRSWQPNFRALFVVCNRKLY